MLGDLREAHECEHRHEFTVLVRGFDANVLSEDELAEHFAKVATVERVKIVRKEGDGRDHAFVDYFKEGAAAVAVAGLNYSEIWASSGRKFTLRVYPRKTSACASMKPQAEDAQVTRVTQGTQTETQGTQTAQTAQTAQKGGQHGGRAGNLSVADVTARTLAVKVSGFEAKSLSRAELIEHMGSVGTVEKVTIVVTNSHEDHAFVWYLTEAATRRAVVELHESTIVTSCHAIFTLRVWIPPSWQRGGGRVIGGNYVLPSPTSVASKDDKTCVVCWSSPRSHKFVPCGHVCVCATCAGAIMKNAARCPSCREPSERTLCIESAAPSR